MWVMVRCGRVLLMTISMFSLGCVDRGGVGGLDSRVRICAPCLTFLFPLFLSRLSLLVLVVFACIIIAQHPVVAACRLSHTLYPSLPKPLSLVSRSRYSSLPTYLPTYPPPTEPSTSPTSRLLIPEPCCGIPPLRPS
ncbi:hypothetical protein FKP32DRAFT_1318184 [Trametes sanguinea]|nr:hypothetical protein FKP32DRAFT_1318184 [Trametes sanguinea]